MTNLDIDAENILKSFVDESSLIAFITDSVISQNGILSPDRRSIMKEYIYTFQELLFVLNVKTEEGKKFEAMVEKSDAQIIIHENSYYSLPKLIKSKDFVHDLFPLTYFNS